jgi:predicted ATPase
MIARLLDLADNPRANAIRQYLRSWRYYTISAEIMRTSRRADWDTFLADDASNVASVLFTLKSEDTRAFNRLVSLVKEIEPSIETLNFIRPRPEEVYMEVEDTEGNRYNPESLSDGTLNYLALCYVALQGSLRTARDTVPPALVAYEEPERGLYVGHLRRFMEVLQEAGKTQQVILTTHNPYLIDLFEDHREQVRLVSRGEHSLRDGTTVAAPDADKLDGLLESFSLGELYYRELLQ